LHWRRGHEELIEHGLLQIEPLTYIRGRTLPKQFFVVDEAQNLTPHEVKTILTRAGEGTKIILTGDPEQIDNPYVDASSNGLTYAVERFKHESIAAHITLSRGERSPLAERATKLL
jgi:PhoH-like ATPase